MKSTDGQCVEDFRLSFFAVSIPHAGPAFPGVPAAQQELPSALLHPHGNHRQLSNCRHGSSRWFSRQLVLQSQSKGSAVLTHRTIAAARAGGSTDPGAEVHDGLIKVTGALGRNEGFGKRPELFLSGCRADIQLQAQQSSIQTLGVRLHTRCGEVKGEGCDRAGRVTPDSGQFLQLHCIGRKLTAMLRYHQSRSPMQSILDVEMRKALQAALRDYNRRYGAP